MISEFIILNSERSERPLLRSIHGQLQLDRQPKARAKYLSICVQMIYGESIVLDSQKNIF